LSFKLLLAVLYCQLFLNNVDAYLCQPGFVADELIVQWHGTSVVLLIVVCCLRFVVFFTFCLSVASDSSYAWVCCAL